MLKVKFCFVLRGRKKFEIRITTSDSTIKRLSGVILCLLASDLDELNRRRLTSSAWTRYSSKVFTNRGKLFFKVHFQTLFLPDFVCHTSPFFNFAGSKSGPEVRKI